MPQVRQCAEETPVLHIQQPEAGRLFRSCLFQCRFMRLYATFLRLPLANACITSRLGLRLASRLRRWFRLRGSLRQKLVEKYIVPVIRT